MLAHQIRTTKALLSSLLRCWGGLHRRGPVEVLSTFEDVVRAFNGGGDNASLERTLDFTVGWDFEDGEQLLESGGVLFGDDAAT